MTHAIPTKIIIEPDVDNFELADITFFSPTYPDGAKARYTFVEISAWVTTWLRDVRAQRGSVEASSSHFGD